MKIFNRQKVINKAYECLKFGFFSKGYNYLKNKKYFFIFLSKSSFLKNEYFFLLGAFLLYKGLYNKSIIYLKKVIFTPSLEKSEILFYLIKAYLNLNNKNKVLFYFNKLLERSFNPFFIILSYYEITKNNINLSLNLNELEDFLPNDNKKIDDKLAFAIFYLLNKKEKKAFDLLKDNDLIFYNIYFFNLIYLKTLYLQKKYIDIIEYFNKNIDYLGCIDTLFIYSASLFKLKLYDQCIKVINELDFIENNIRNKINTAKIYYNKNKYTLAIDTLKSLLKKSVKETDYILYLLTLSYQKLGLLNDSLKYAKKIDNKSVEYSKVMFNLSILYYDLGEYDSAKEIFDNIKKDFINNNLYYKWSKRISSTMSIKKNIPVILINIIPWIIIIFSLIIYLIFNYLMNK